MSNKDKARLARELAFYAIFSAGVRKGDPMSTLDDILESQVEWEHPYRKIIEAIRPGDLADFLNLNSRPVVAKYDFPAEFGLRAILMAFWKNLPFRELVVSLKERLEIRWFSGYNMAGGVPREEYFERLTDEIGTGGLLRLFKKAGQRLAKTDVANPWAAYESYEAIESRLAEWKKQSGGKKKSANYKGLCDEIVERISAWKENSETIDQIIKDNLKKGRWEDMAEIARATLRLGICEMEFMKSVPAEVAVNEAVEMAKTFGDASLAGFVNGILDARLKKPAAIEIEMEEQDTKSRES